MNIDKKVAEQSHQGTREIKPNDVPSLTLAMDCTSTRTECSDSCSDLDTTVEAVPLFAKSLPAQQHHRRLPANVDSDVTTNGRSSVRDVLRPTWKTVLAFSAFLDFISTVLPILLAYELAPAEDTNERDSSTTSSLSSLLKNRVFYHPIVQDFIAWLESNTVYFGFAFSLVWCVQAFREARQKRKHALRERDRKRLLSRGDSIRFLEDDDPLNKYGYFQGTGPWLIFYAALAVQLVLVPVGFYVLLYECVQLFIGTTSQEPAGLDLAVELEQSVGVTEKENTMRSIINSTSKVIDIRIGRESFATDGKLSVVMLVAKHIGNAAYEAVGARLKNMLVKKGWKEGRKLGVRAIINPRKVWKKIAKAMRWIRWAKYLAPLLAASNKLRGNLFELLKKYRQRREAVLAMKIREILWKKMTLEERKDKAARGMQSMYRSYRVRRMRWALAIFQCQKDELAAIRVQTVLRKMLYRARCRIKQKQEELKKLEAKEEAAIRNRTRRRMTMSPYERKRLYELQDEMKSTKSNSIDRRLLLRPNTRFAVIWKFLFVFCVFIEICGLAVNPLVATRKKINKKPSTFAIMLEQVVVPTPVSGLKICSCMEKEREEFNSWILASTMPTKCPSDPWFCHPTFARIQAFYIVFMIFILEHFMAIVGFIVFLDVPVHFYTGELCPEMGSVVPKPFFVRWIAPGLLLQLAVNPQMGSTSALVCTLAKHACNIGLVRVWRWIDAFFYPTLVAVVDFVEHIVWVPLVSIVNQSTEKEDIFCDETSIDHPATRRRASVNCSVRRASARASVVYGPRGRTSILLQQQASSDQLKMRRSSLLAVVPSRRFALVGPPTASFYDEMKKEV